jgi:iron-sulfur cluster repair protein YtfE (RIC family)
MNQTCTCHPAAPRSAGITADQIVAEVAHRSPALLAVMKAMGINHCCGAQLTLAEAAAAAGVAGDALVEALNQAAVSQG